MALAACSPAGAARARLQRRRAIRERRLLDARCARRCPDRKSSRRRTAPAALPCSLQAVPPRLFAWYDAFAGCRCKLSLRRPRRAWPPTGPRPTARRTNLNKDAAHHAHHRLTNRAPNGITTHGDPACPLRRFPRPSPMRPGRTSSSRIIFASFIGTAIEFYDFYVYATAAALVIGPVFFPHGSATAQALVGLRHVRHRVRRAADRLVPVRPLRRPDRP